MAIDVRAYLEAKADLDRRSLNREVLSVFGRRLRGKAKVRLLEVGCGTGVHLCRLAKVLGAKELELTGLEREVSLVRAAPELCRKRLESQGWSCWIEYRQAAPVLIGERGEQNLRLSFICADLWEFTSDSKWDAVCAHFFLDLVPVRQALFRIALWLEPRGLLYASANYDGGTFLFPPEEGFEANLLARYDASMEERRVAGEKCGGARSARRLFSVLCQTGWHVLAYGSSDWNLTPVEGSYRAADQTVLLALLEMIASEGQTLDPAASSAWYQRRLAQLQQGELGMIIHQVDLVACRP